MKKPALVLSVLLLIFSAALAEARYTAFLGGAQLLTVSYDNGAYSLDTESYLAGNYGGHTWLGMFYNGSYTVELSADRYPDLSPSCDLNTLSSYLSGVLAGEQCAPIGQYTTRNHITFVLFSLNGSSGQSYYAAAMIQGCAVHFEIYNLRGGVGPEALFALKGLLEGVSQ